MANNDYITIDDINAKYLKQVPDPVKQEYVDKTNNWYEVYASSKNISIDSIEFPVNLLVKDMLLFKLGMFYTWDNRGGSRENATEDFYTREFYDLKGEFIASQEIVNSGVIRGDINSSSTTRIMSRAVRS